MCTPGKLTLDLSKVSHLDRGKLRLQTPVSVSTWVGGFELRSSAFSEYFGPFLSLHQFLETLVSDHKQSVLCSPRILCLHYVCRPVWSFFSVCVKFVLTPSSFCLPAMNMQFPAALVHLTKGSLSPVELANSSKRGQVLVVLLDFRMLCSTRDWTNL